MRTGTETAMSAHPTTATARTNLTSSPSARATDDLSQPGGCLDERGGKSVRRRTCAALSRDRRRSRPHLEAWCEDAVADDDGSKDREAVDDAADLRTGGRRLRDRRVERRCTRTSRL